MGLLDRLFGGKPKEPKVDTFKAAKEYLRYIIENPLEPMTAVDESTLPYKKADIKSGLLSVMRAAKSAKARKPFRAAYIKLAQFQPDVGSEPMGRDLEAIDIDGDINDFNASLEQMMEDTNPWVDKILAEFEELEKELSLYGY